jgi:hypothetical protein
MRTVESVRAQVLGQLEPSADGIEVLRPLRVPGNGPASERGFHLAAEILDEDVQEVAVLLPEAGLAYAIDAEIGDASPAARRARKFPRAASARIILSSVRSDTARRSRWFSAASALSRFN